MRRTKLGALMPPFVYELDLCSGLPLLLFEADSSSCFSFMICHIFFCDGNTHNVYYVKLKICLVVKSWKSNRLTRTNSKHRLMQAPEWIAGCLKPPCSAAGAIRCRARSLSALCPELLAFRLNSIASKARPKPWNFKPKSLRPAQKYPRPTQLG